MRVMGVNLSSILRMDIGEMCGYCLKILDHLRLSMIKSLILMRKSQFSKHSDIGMTLRIGTMTDIGRTLLHRRGCRGRRM